MKWRDGGNIDSHRWWPEHGRESSASGLGRWGPLGLDGGRYMGVEMKAGNHSGVGQDPSWGT